jgi:hypothetical protein
MTETKPLGNTERSSGPFLPIKYKNMSRVWWHNFGVARPALETEDSSNLANLASSDLPNCFAKKVSYLNAF